MGVAIRCRHPLPLALPSRVWKPLVGEPLDAEDLAAVDLMAVQSLSALRQAPEDGVASEAEFKAAYRGLCWVTSGSDGAEVEVVPGGRTKPVTLADRLEYCAAVEQLRLAEGAAAVAAMKRGLETLVPVRVLTVFKWRELEALVCGRPEIDVELLMAHTEYRGFRPSDPTILHFWNVLRSFTNEQVTTSN